MKLRTWHVERAVAAGVLAIGAAFSATDWRAWLSAAAVLAAFAHGQIADRLAEREAARARPSVECHRKALLYFVAKEVLWVAFFLSTHAYPPLLGCAIFLVYPLWRRAWRRRFPLNR